MVKSHWTKYVEFLALTLLDYRTEWPEPLQEKLLNGARDWKEYSWGGCGMIYDPDIAAHACTNSEYKLTRGGQKEPNAREHWLDVQARAYFQAAALLKQLHIEHKDISEVKLMLEPSYFEIQQIAKSRTDR